VEAALASTDEVVLDGAGQLGVVSPHMDDAVLSCGRVLSAHPGAQVVTVFSGGPPRVAKLPPWDRKSGHFKPGDDVMKARALEDEEALALAGAGSHRLGLWDAQYRGWRAPASRAVTSALVSKLNGALLWLADRGLADELYARLRATVEALDARTWLVPLGLAHIDHRLTARACLRLAHEVAGRKWVAYEDLPYGALRPTDLVRAKRRAYRSGFRLEGARFAHEGSTSQKAALLACYRSQLPCLGLEAEVALESPEVFHLLVKRG